MFTDGCFACGADGHSHVGVVVFGVWVCVCCHVKVFEWFGGEEGVEVDVDKYSMPGVACDPNRLLDGVFGDAEVGEDLVVDLGVSLRTLRVSMTALTRVGV